MPWIYALELLALIAVAWRVSAALSAIARELRSLNGDDDGE